MTKRKITDLYNVKFVPFDNYGAEVPGMSWHKISYDKKNGGYGSYLLKMEFIMVKIYMKMMVLLYIFFQKIKLRNYLKFLKI